MSSFSLLNSSYKNKSVYNNLEVNNLQINETSLIKNVPFAGKLYEMVAPTGDKYQYKFSMNGSYYDLLIVTSSGESSVAFPYVKIIETENNSRTYFSKMTYQTLPNLESQIILRYVMTGMQFNEDYTEVNTAKSIGGPYFEYNPLFLNILVDGYNKENQELATSMIKEGKLIFVPDMFPTLLTLVN